MLQVEQGSLYPALHRASNGLGDGLQFCGVDCVGVERDVTHPSVKRFLVEEGLPIRNYITSIPANHIALDDRSVCE